MYSSRLLASRLAVPAAVVLGLAAAEGNRSSTDQRPQRGRLPVWHLGGGAALMEAAAAGAEQEQGQQPPRLNRRHPCTAHGRFIKGQSVLLGGASMVTFTFASINTNDALLVGTPHTGCKELKIFSGRGHQSLATEVGAELGVLPGNITVSSFADGETQVQVQESVRGLDVYIFQRYVRQDVTCRSILFVSTEAGRSFTRSHFHTPTAATPPSTTASWSCCSWCRRCTGQAPRGSRP